MNNPNGPVIAQRHQHLLTTQKRKSAEEDPNVVIAQRHRFNTLPAPVKNIQPPQPVQSQPQRHQSPSQNSHRSVWTPGIRYPTLTRNNNNVVVSQRHQDSQIRPLKTAMTPVQNQPTNLGHSVRKLTGTTQQPQTPTITIQGVKTIESLRKSFGSSTQEEKQGN